MPCELLKPVSEEWKPNIELELNVLYDVLKVHGYHEEFLKGFKFCLDHYIELKEAIEE